MRLLRSAVHIFFLVALPASAVAQTNYHDPQGRFEIQIPAGWQLTVDKSVDQITISNHAVQMTVYVSLQNKTNAMTAREFIDSTAQEFQGQCPSFKNRQKGSVVLAGYPGIYQLFTCSDSTSPAVAETDAALTKGNVLIGFTTISPVSRYFTVLPAFDAIRDSLRLIGRRPDPTEESAAEAITQSNESSRMTDLKKACLAGVFSQEECARRVGMEEGQEKLTQTGGNGPVSGSDVGRSGRDAGPIGTAGLAQHSPVAMGGAAYSTGTSMDSTNRYHDPMGRFSIQVPHGWKATAEGENGILGAQLRSGSNWINVMPAKGGASCKEIVLDQERAMAASSHSDRKAPFGPLGLIQLFGNGVEVTYDHFAATSDDGARVESYIGGVGDISGKGTMFLLVVGSLRPGASGKGEAADEGALFLAAAQSVQMGRN
jgi:hypothetical protein